MLDTAKAVAISFVIFWHLKPLGIGDSVAGATREHMQFALAVLYKQVAVSAVPLFMLVSLHLLYSKLEELGVVYALRRIRRLAALFIVWTLFQFGLFYGVHALLAAMTGHSFAWPDIGKPLHIVMMTGGPPLPLVGGSVFYFLFALLLLSVGATAFHAIPGRPRYRTALACVLVTIGLCYFQVMNWKGGRLDYYRLENFLIYIPLAYLVRTHKPYHRHAMAALLLAGFVLFATQDVYLRDTVGSTGAYSRPSVVFGAMTLYYLLRAWCSGPVSKATAFLARYSLGIFALHKVWWLVIVWVAEYCRPLRIDFPLDLVTLAKTLLCVALTCGTAYLLGRTRLRWLVQ